MQTRIALLVSKGMQHRRTIRYIVTALFLIAAAVGLGAPFGSSDS